MFVWYVSLYYSIMDLWNLIILYLSRIDCFYDVKCWLLVNFLVLRKNVIMIYVIWIIRFVLFYEIYWILEIFSLFGLFIIMILLYVCV